jgi:hypothetical protein
MYPKVLRYEDRKEGKGEAEPENRGELGEPEGSEVAPPIDG